MKSDVISIRDVAIYLRKSRGDEEDLSKHKEDLIELCEQNGWRYTIYAEVGSSIKFHERPQMQQMLEDIKAGDYDAVVVIDRDRLSRDYSGQGIINQALIEKEVLIVTPTKVYDLTNDNDVLMSEFEDLMARLEYRTITKRFRRGKRRGAKRGEWTNGKPPLPYIYNPEIKGLEVDEEKLEVYRFIIDEFLGGNSPYDIAWELNKRKIPSPRGGLWKDISVRRLLEDETHLGRIISNKTSKWNRSKGSASYTVNKKEDWIIVENCHKSVKTLVEHEKIIGEFQRRKRSTYAKRGTLALTGLIKCGKCGKTMSLLRQKNGNHFVKKCQSLKEDGISTCGGEGGRSNIILEEILRQLNLLYADIEKEIKRTTSNTNFKSSIKREITRRENLIKQHELELEQVTKLALSGFFNPDEAVQQKTKLLNEIKNHEDEIMTLNAQNETFGEMSNKERLENIQSVMEKLNDEDSPSHVINRILKSVIHSIIWERNNNILNLQINFI